MNLSATKLFAYSYPLPAPYDTLTSKKVSAASAYSLGGTEATLSPSVIKALHAVINCMNGTSYGALGLIDHRSVVEYQSAIPDDYHLVVYDPVSGQLQASVFNMNTDSSGAYSFTNNKGKRDGAAVFMAAFPTLMEDEEFKDAFALYKDAHDKSLPDLDAASKLLGLLCDNAYRRVTDENCAVHVKLNIDAAGNLTRIPKTQIDAGKYTPRSVIAGAFQVFAKTPTSHTIQRIKTLDHRDFLGQYTLNPSRALSVSEQNLVPALEPWYIIPDEVVGICKHAVATTSKHLPMRNFLLRGPAGTGKTAGARAIAAGLGLPYVKYTCSANTEIFDMIGQVFPDTATATTGDADLDRQRDELQAMGGITTENVMKLLKLPDMDDIAYDPAGSYMELTGMEKDNASLQDCMHVMLERVAERMRLLTQVQESDKGQSYVYVETDFVRALRNGWLVEIQEPATIMQPGVLVGLNSLLEQSGSITLPTNEVIGRHPDTVVVITTNISYEGCRGINQSVVDRMNLVQDIELPSDEIMAERAMQVTGCTDQYMVSQMVGVVREIAEYCRSNGITDGNCGIRSLIDWIISSEITGDPYTSALYTIISKATSDEDDRNALRETILEQQFQPKTLHNVV